MYLLLPPATMSEVLEQQPELLRQFVRGEPGAREVLIDVLLAERGEKFERWPAARKAHATKENVCLFVIWTDRIRQRVRKTQERFTGWGVEQRTLYGWREIDATKKLRKGSAK